MILKLNSGGSGIGTYVENECTSQEWEKIMRENWNKYLMQHFLDQKKNDDSENQRKICLVGMLLCKDDKTYESGLFCSSGQSFMQEEYNLSNIRILKI
ncbi:hypothetical protein [Flavobacterium foetidum]|uniref:hypothetical protein n=1 Tax=Flavobacterium foetidum TaxID=2026681 RepID=UPI00107542FC|nr:hypothetical protein [Flavobacterium foetidum]KAF2513441.1 hypothetical protein E0W73_14420 [Flavobacterium foetidum]